MPTPSIAYSSLQELAREVGLEVVAVSDTAALEGDKAFLQSWQDQGHAAELRYMEREADLLASPLRLLPSARSIVVFGVPYDAVQVGALGPDEGRVARYAWGRDYHRVLRKRLEAFVRGVEAYVGGSIEHRLFADSVPLLERALARKSGMGFIGKNTMLIAPRIGSFLFLAEVLWGVDVEMPLRNESRGGGVVGAGAGCGSCTRCIDDCPTGAFVSERVLDAGRCISYLTIEKRGALTHQEREWLGDWVFGCDRCQEVCPHNFVTLKRGRRASLPELSASAGVGQVLSLSEVLGMRTAESFQARFAGTALMRTKREGLLRNAAVVGANKHAPHLLSILEDVVTSDTSALVRQHALWSHAVISAREGARAQAHTRQLLEKALNDGAPEVQEEARQMLPNLL
jgi:epoxyqueuosine reductase